MSFLAAHSISTVVHLAVKLLLPNPLFCDYFLWLICAVVTCLMVIGRLVFKDLRRDILGAPPLSERPYFLSYISLAS